MAVFLVAARDLPSGYSKGDPVAVLPDDHVFGGSEGLPDFWQITVTGLPVSLVHAHVNTELWEPAIIGDDEYEAPDEVDRRIRRHRRNFRVMWDEIPAQWLDALEATGRATVSAAQARPYVRRVRWNRGQRRVEKTSNEVF